jgi:hypothetical protein
MDGKCRYNFHPTPNPLVRFQTLGEHIRRLGHEKYVVKTEVLNIAKNIFL